jgi:DNA-binding transcriptional regulator YhcF (GntR family)
MTTPSFKGIRFPISLLVDTSLSSLDRLLVAEIVSLDKGEGCFAGNKFIGRSVNLHRAAISRALKELLNTKVVSDNPTAQHKRTLRSKFGSSLSIDDNNDPYTWVGPELWLDEELSPSEKLLLIIAMRYDFGDGCRVPDSQLASDHGASPRTLNRMLAKLSKEKLISISGSTRKRTIILSEPSSNLEKPHDNKQPFNTYSPAINILNIVDSTNINTQDYEPSEQQLTTPAQQLTTPAQQVGIELTTQAQQLTTKAKQLTTPEQHHIEDH